MDNVITSLLPPSPILTRTVGGIPEYEIFEMSVMYGAGLAADNKTKVSPKRRPNKNS